MQLGFVSAILPELSLDEVLSLAAAEGFECVEAMCGLGFYPNPLDPDPTVSAATGGGPSPTSTRRPSG